MLIYNYHPITGEFISFVEADESPLEPGVYLIPANSTEKIPPDQVEKQVIIFENGEWVKKPDYRGKRYYKIDTKESFIITEIGVEPDNTMVESVPDIYDKWDSIQNKWVLDLEKYKDNKIDELNNACNQSILGRFTSTVNGVQYQFSYDAEAQSNFSKAGRAFDKNLVTSVSWTAYEIETGNMIRLTLDVNAFDAVFADSLNHVNSNVSNFRDVLQPQVNAATSKDEVDAIVWK